MPISISKPSLTDLRLRARASTSAVRLHLPCFTTYNDGAQTRGISRALTAAGRVNSAATRRGGVDLGDPYHDADWSGERQYQLQVSPIEVQQYREGYRPRRERLVATNRNSEREDERVSIPSSANSGQFGPRTMRGETMQAGTEPWNHIIANAAEPHSRIRDSRIPDWETDIEAQLDGEVQRLIGLRDFGLERVVQPPRRRTTRVRHGSERRRARVFDDGVDYTVLQPSSSSMVGYESEGIRPELSGQELESRGVRLPGVPDSDLSYLGADTRQYRNLRGRRERRELPRAPPPAASAGQLERIVDTGIGGGERSDPRTIRGRDDVYRPQPAIRSSMFRSTIHNPPPPTPKNPDIENFTDFVARTGTHIANLGTRAAQTIASRVMGAAEAKLSAPPPPQQSSNTNRVRNEDTLRQTAGLILTTQEFPPVLSREGAGSRYHSHLTRSQLPRARLQVPSITIQSPTHDSSGPSFRASASSQNGSRESISTTHFSNTYPPSSPNTSNTSESDGEKGEEGWTRLTVKTKEWDPFPGEWADEGRWNFF
ncbi:MAG: hypothetical protein Q9170_006037 [Blastenia crenularia]